MSDRSTDNARLSEHAERVVARLDDGRFVLATFVMIQPGEIERAHEGPGPAEIRPPGFMDVVAACELIGQGACRPYEGLHQITA